MFSVVVIVMTCMWLVMGVAILRKRGDAAGRRYRFSLLAMLTGGLTVNMSQLSGKPFLPDEFAMALALIMVIGANGMVSTMSKRWRGWMLDDLLTSCYLSIIGWLVLGLATPLATSHHMLLQGAVCAAYFTAVLTVGRIARIRSQESRTEASLLMSYIATVSLGQVLVLSHVMTQDRAYLDMARSVTVAGGVLICVYFVLRIRHREATQWHDLGRSKPPFFHYHLAAVACALSSYCLTFRAEVVNLMVMTFIFMAIAAVCGRTIATLLDYEKLDAQAERKAAYYRGLVQNSNDVIMLFDPQTARSTYVSPAADHVLSIPSHLLRGQRITQVLGGDSQQLDSLFRATVQQSTVGRFESTINGRSVESTLSRHAEYVMVVTRDVTDCDALRDALHQAAYSDNLTGLGNRLAVMKALQARESLEHNTTGVLFVDLDRFKQINDAHGHDVGDAVLRQAAARLRDCVDERAVLGRLGGDEFVVVVDASEYDLDLIADTIREALREPFVVDNVCHQLGASIGMAATDGTVTAADLLRRADAAMYAAKRSRRDTVRYSADLTHNMIQNMERDAELANALQENRLEIATQVVVNPHDRCVTALDVSLCWRDAEGLLRPADDVLQFAAHVGQLERVSWNYLDRALQVAAQAGHIHRIAMPISAEMLLGNGFAERVRDHIVAAQVAPNKLCFVVPEDDDLNGDHQAYDVLAALQALGVNVTVSGLGGAASSLACLVDAPINGVRLDPSIIESLPTSAAARSVVRMILDVAEQRGLDVVAAGVTSRVQHQWIQALKFKAAQGSFYGHPLPIYDSAGEPGVTMTPGASIGASAFR